MPRFSFLFLIIPMALSPAWSWWLPERCEERQPKVQMDRSGNQVKDGEEWACYPDGLWKHRMTWDNGVGTMTRWFRNGQKYLEGPHEKGIMHGPWTEWHENGQKAAEGTYNQGKKEGTWTFWHESGQPSRLGCVDNFRKVWVVCKDPIYLDNEYGMPEVGMTNAYGIEYPSVFMTHAQVGEIIAATRAAYEAMLQSSGLEPIGPF